MDAGTAPGGQRGRGLFVPGKKNGRGRDENEILSGVFKSKGKGEHARGIQLAPQPGCPGGGSRAKWPGWVLGGRGSGCARRSVGSRADTRSSRCPASAFFKPPCQ